MCAMFVWSSAYSTVQIACTGQRCRGAPHSCKAVLASHRHVHAKRIFFNRGHPACRKHQSPALGKSIIFYRRDAPRVRNARDKLSALCAVSSRKVSERRARFFSLLLSSLLFPALSFTTSSSRIPFLLREYICSLCSSSCATRFSHQPQQYSSYRKKRNGSCADIRISPCHFV